MRLPSFVLVSAVSILANVALPARSYADSFTASYLAAGVQTPNGITNNVNTFDLPSYVALTRTTTFNASGIVGTYSGDFRLAGADAYGGAGGSGNYILTNTTYTLTLSSAANYFGLWFSALDAGNQLSFYNGNTLLYAFTPTAYQSLVGACPNAQNAFCGNPNTTFKGQDSSEQFAYLNFSDTNGTFNKIVFTQTNPAGGFESDNHAVALNPAPGAPLGTAIVTPEPSTWVLALTGIAAIAGITMVRRMNATDDLA